MHALIDQTGLVVQVEARPFEVHDSLEWVLCADEVAHGWTYHAGAFASSPTPPEPSPSDQLAGSDRTEMGRVAEDAMVLANRLLSAITQASSLEALRTSVADLQAPPAAMDKIARRQALRTRLAADISPPGTT